MPHPAITAAVFERTVAFLAPLFLDPEVSDIAAARRAARSTLDSYAAKTDCELRLVALTIAFSFGALDALGRAADPVLPVNQVIRLRGNANALNRAATQSENRLDRLRRQPPVAGQTKSEADRPHDPGAEELPISTAISDLLAFAAAAPPSIRADTKSVAGCSAALGAASRALVVEAPTLPRQQRRAAARQAEKLRRGLLQQAKRAQWVAERRAKNGRDRGAYPVVTEATSRLSGPG